MTWPNFLVVGGARCGSTSLCALLGRHPDVFVSPTKEPSFFLFEGHPPAFTGPGDEGLVRMVVTTESDYQALFDDAGDAVAIGEGSVFYLHRPEVFDHIEERVPGIKDGREPETEFRAALADEDRRREAGWEWIWEYAGGGFYADRLERLIDCFGRERVLILRHEDLADDRAGLLAEAFTFLGVDPQASIGGPGHVNASGAPRSRRVQSFLTEPNGVKDRLRPLVPDRLWQRAYHYVQRRNVQPLTLPDDVRAELAPGYAADIDRVEQITGWDLAAWRAPAG